MGGRLPCLDCFFFILSFERLVFWLLFSIELGYLICEYVRSGCNNRCSLPDGCAYLNGCGYGCISIPECGYGCVRGYNIF